MLQVIEKNIKILVSWKGWLKSLKTVSKTPNTFSTFQVFYGWPTRLFCRQKTLTGLLYIKDPTISSIDSRSSKFLSRQKTLPGFYSGLLLTEGPRSCLGSSSIDRRPFQVFHRQKTFPGSLLIRSSIDPFRSSIDRNHSHVYSRQKTLSSLLQTEDASRSSIDRRPSQIFNKQQTLQVLQQIEDASKSSFRPSIDRNSIQAFCIQKILPVF